MAPRPPRHAAAAKGEVVVALSGVSKRYGPIQALAGRRPRAARRRGALPRRRERRRQEHADQDPHRRRSSATRARTRSTAATSATRARSQARDAGVGVVYQELSLLPDLSVGENLMMGRLPARRGITRPGELRAARARDARAGRAGVAGPDARRSRRRSLAVRQLVEIAKVLGANPRVLIFDEPTTALSETRDQGAARPHPRAARRGPRDHVRLATTSRRCSRSATA